MTNQLFFGKRHKTPAFSFIIVLFSAYLFVLQIATTSPHLHAMLHGKSFHAEEGKPTALHADSKEEASCVVTLFAQGISFEIPTIFRAEKVTVSDRYHPLRKNHPSPKPLFFTNPRAPPTLLYT